MLLKCVPTWLMRDRRASISGAHWERVQGMLTSTLLKRGTFMVLILNGCGLLHWISLSLARDTYDAYSRRADVSQGLFL